VQFAEPDHWLYAGSALFFLGVAWRVMLWVWRTSRELQKPSAAESAMTADELRKRAEAREAREAKRRGK
jgi:hypothetical protein